jgi:glutathione S-transferase
MSDLIVYGFSRSTFVNIVRLGHGDFTVYETSAIVSYLEEIFPTPALQPKSVRDRAALISL